MNDTSGSLKVGEEIPTLTKTAYMPINETQRNVIHTDDYARKYGMRGALIGGSTLLSYVLEMLYGYFDSSWLYTGKIRVSFIGGGAIGGDVLTAHGLLRAMETEESGTRLKLDVWMENQEKTKILVGEASCIR